MRTWIKLAVLSALFVLLLGTGVSFAQTTEPTSPCYPLAADQCVDPNAGGAGAGQAQGLPRTGSSDSIPTAAIAAGMVGVGSVLAIAARRRSTARRALG